ncbi:MAG: mannitol dehydrogenase family protein, partial [Microbacterium sp.]
MTRPPTLSTRSLAEVAQRVPVPSYARDGLTAGIAHIGVGNFHRSHQAEYLDRLLAQDPTAPWAILGVGARAEDAQLAAALDAQDGLYSLSLFHPDGAVETRVIGSLTGMTLLAEDPAATVAALADPQVRIVSLTVTESGYVEDPTTGRRAADDRGIQADAAGGFTTPHTAFGLIVAALRARRNAGIPPFSVLSCDNIPHNGDVARASVLAVARCCSDELATWVAENVGFPNSMVDRITPRATTDQVATAEAALGVRDAAPVAAEPFQQWVIEDDFRSGRPALERVGVVITDDIGAYEDMKLRLLNGAHQVLAYVGLLRGHRFVHEAMGDAVVRAWLDRYWGLVLPCLRLPEGVDGEDYVR